MPPWHEVERALELDPASLFPNFVLGWLYGVSRRFDEAIPQHSWSPSSLPIMDCRISAWAWLTPARGQFEDAIAHFTNANPDEVPLAAARPTGLLLRHGRTAGRKPCRKSPRLTNAPSHYVSPTSFAAIYAGLGDTRTSAFAPGARLEVRDTSLPVNLLNPEFDSLRNEPRLQALRERSACRKRMPFGRQAEPTQAMLK